jgi:hypothetical protein
VLRLIREARRRRVFRVAGLYVVAWVLLQVADVVFPGLGIPDTAVSALMYAVVLDFPVALVFGWMFDIGVDGLRRTAPLEFDSDIGKVTAIFAGPSSEERPCLRNNRGRLYLNIADENILHSGLANPFLTP